MILIEMSNRKVFYFPFFSPSPLSGDKDSNEEEMKLGSVLLPAGDYNLFSTVCNPYGVCIDFEFDSPVKVEVISNEASDYTDIIR